VVFNTAMSGYQEIGVGLPECSDAAGSAASWADLHSGGSKGFEDRVGADGETLSEPS
jgi:hypothetical protein